MLEIMYYDLEMQDDGCVGLIRDTGIRERIHKRRG